MRCGGWCRRGKSCYHHSGTGRRQNETGESALLCRAFCRDREHREGPSDHRARRNQAHIGCCVLAQPRPSLAGDGKVSATSSVLNVVGHKDEALCRYLAERAAAVHRCNAVCTGGFHVDNMTGAQIEELLAAVKELEI